jgi:hypothetical protein
MLFGLKKHILFCDKTIWNSYNNLKYARKKFKYLSKTYYTNSWFLAENSYPVKYSRGPIDEIENDTMQIQVTIRYDIKD